MRVVFAGTPDFAVPSLQKLLQSQHEVVAVFTQPDRPAGRGRQLRPSPVKACALEAGLPIHHPTTLRDVQIQNTLGAMSPDVMVVVAYGLLLPKQILELPKYGCVNVHPSLLPRWRGAAPIQHTLLAGDKETGVAIMQLDVGMDTGPIYRMEKAPVESTDNSATLHDRLAVLGAGLLVKTLDELQAGTITAKPQTSTGVTYANKINKADAVIDWHLPARDIFNQVRAFNPWPVSQTYWNDRALRVWEAALLDEVSQEKPGTIIAANEHGIDVATTDGCLRLLRVQLPGGKQMAASDFANQLKQCKETQILGAKDAR